MEEDRGEAEATEAVLTTRDGEEAAGSSPEIVARRIAAIIETKSPAVRYTAGAFAQRLLVALKPFLPSRLYETCLMKYYGLRRR